MGFVEHVAAGCEAVAVLASEPGLPCLTGDWDMSIMSSSSALSAVPAAVGAAAGLEPAGRAGRSGEVQRSTTIGLLFRGLAGAEALAHTGAAALAGPLRGAVFLTGLPEACTETPVNQIYIHDWITSNTQHIPHD